MNIGDTIAPKSEQMDAIDLLNGPQTFTIERVTEGNPEQPFNLHLAGFPRPWRPGLSMRRVLVYCWGGDASAYVGRRVRLFCDPTVKFGGQAVGGIRVEALSHIDKPKSIPLLVTRGKSAMFTVQPLKDDEPAPAKPTGKQVADAIAHYAERWDVPLDRLEARIGRPSSKWTARDMTMLRAVSTELANGATTPGAEFPEIVNLPDDDSREPTDEQYALYDDEAAGAET